MLIGDAHCTKKITGTLKKHRSKECVVFIFKQSVVICEKVSSDQEFSEAQIDYWISFHVSGIIPIKVHIFWEGKKNLRNLHLTFVYSTYRQKLGEDFSKFCDLLSNTHLSPTHLVFLLTKLCFYRNKREKNLNFFLDAPIKKWFYINPY